jgi:hypothetical protein
MMNNYNEEEEKFILTEYLKLDNEEINDFNKLLTRQLMIKTLFNLLEGTWV